jgi:hypothetical protein
MASLTNKTALIYGRVARNWSRHGQRSKTAE